MNQSIQAIILAAGKSTRFNTGRTKLIEPLCGQPLILYPLQTISSIHIPTVVVIGHEADALKKIITQHYTVDFALQSEQKGTGDALKASKKLWFAEHILVLNGDMPLISSSVINQLIEKHVSTDAAITFTTSYVNNDSALGYGKIINNKEKIRIVESKDTHTTDQSEPLINAGIYIFKKSFLENFIFQLDCNNASQEYYLTDLINLASDTNTNIQTIVVSFDTIRGINTLKELEIAEQIKRAEIISHYMSQGVRFFSTQNVCLDTNVRIGKGTIIHYGVHIINGSTIGENCCIEPFSIIDNSKLSDCVTVLSHSVIKDSTIESKSSIGPFAHLRNHTYLERETIIGNFVELKASRIGKESKAKHLSYLGDALIGSKVNIGAGTITCNHNGVSKKTTIIQDSAYIGSNTTLIAPVTVGKNAYTAAGSTITQSIPDDALAIGRSHQINKEGYAIKLKRKFKETQDEQPSQKDDPHVSFIGALKTHNDSTMTDVT